MIGDNDSFLDLLKFQGGKIKAYILPYINGFQQI